MAYVDCAVMHSSCGSAHPVVSKRYARLQNIDDYKLMALSSRVLSLCLLYTNCIRCQKPLPLPPVSFPLVTDSMSSLGWSAQQYVKAGIEMPFALLQLTVTACIVRQILQKKETFGTAFFKLFVAQSIADTIVYLTVRRIHWSSIKLLS